jgi:hypothetical protein
MTRPLVAATVLSAALALPWPASAEPTRRTAPVGVHVANLIGSCVLDRAACVDYEGPLGLDPKERCEQARRRWNDTPCAGGRLVGTCTRVEGAGFSHTRSYAPVTLETARAACRGGDGNFQPPRGK